MTASLTHLASNGSRTRPRMVNPVMIYNEERFFGRDRLAMLAWRLRGQGQGKKMHSPGPVRSAADRRAD